MHGATHGILIGLIGTLPLAFGGLESGSFLIIMLFGALWGFLMELFATLIFKAPMRKNIAVSVAGRPEGIISWLPLSQNIAKASFGAAAENSPLGTRNSQLTGGPQCLKSRK